MGCHEIQKRRHSEGNRKKGQLTKWDKIFAYYSFDKGLITARHKELLKTPINKQTEKVLKRSITASKYLSLCQSSLVMRDTQTTATVRVRLMSVTGLLQRKRRDMGSGMENGWQITYGGSRYGNQRRIASKR